MRIIFVAISDLQCGHRFGLLSPNTELEPDEISHDDYWVPKQTAIQKQLYKWFSQDKKSVLDLAGEDEIYVLCLGDVTHGTAFKKDLVSQRLSDQTAIAHDILAEYIGMDNCIGGRLIKGTAVHSADHGTTELIVARTLRIAHGKDVKAWHHLSLKAKGIYFDLAHKGPPPGKRTWLSGNEVRYYVRSIMDEHLKAGERPPDVILRGHYHERRFELVHDHTWRGTHRTWGIIIPAFSIMADDYTRGATKSQSHMTAGTVAIEVVNGRVKDVYDFTHVVDIRRREVLR